MIFVWTLDSVLFVLSIIVMLLVLVIVKFDMWVQARKKKARDEVAQTIP